LSYGR